MIFSGERLDLFMASYMAMRRIDDQIDELSPDDRHARSPGLAHVDAWQERVDQAARGEAVDLCEADGAIWRMLAARLPNANFDDRPFLALAQAMRHDAKGQDLADWPAFLDYCTGATVAPTAIYLALMNDARRPAHWDEIWTWAQPLAQFCYLAHIVRDLRKDALAGEHLLTIPRELYTDLASDRLALAAGLRHDDAFLAKLASRLLDCLPPVLGDLQNVIGQARAALTTPSKLILGRLLSHYGGVLEASAKMIGRHEFTIPPFISRNESSI